MTAEEIYFSMLPRGYSEKSEFHLAWVEPSTFRLLIRMLLPSTRVRLLQRSTRIFSEYPPSQHRKKSFSFPSPRLTCNFSFSPSWRDQSSWDKGLTSPHIVCSIDKIFCEDNFFFHFLGNIILEPWTCSSLCGSCARPRDINTLPA